MGNLKESCTDEEWDNIPSELAKTKSHFFNLTEIPKCQDVEHNPPSHLHIPQGQGYKHVCPSCGKVTKLIPPQIIF